MNNYTIELYNDNNYVCKATVLSSNTLIIIASVVALARKLANKKER